MSKVMKQSDKREEDAPFHRVELSGFDKLRVTAGAQPTTIWIPAGYTVAVVPEKDMVIDVSEAVQHEDIVSLDRKVRELKMEARRAKRDERRARRRLRRGERPVDGDKPKEHP